MKTTCLFVVLLLSTLNSICQEARYETATGTNTITIADYESAELICVLNTNAAVSEISPSATAVKATKNGYSFMLHSSASRFAYSGSGGMTASGNGDVLRGPATFQLAGINFLSAQGFTIKITPVSFPPNQTLIVPPGTNQVQISMESSTNLLNWAAATNGVYGSPETVRFFRLKMTNLQP